MLAHLRQEACSCLLRDPQSELDELGSYCLNAGHRRLEWVLILSVAIAESVCS
jgi:hypothetical protein